MTGPIDFFDYLEQSLQSLGRDEADHSENIRKMYSLVRQFFILAGDDEPLHFTTLFARISHICARKEIAGHLVARIQRFRINAEAFLRKGLPDESESASEIWISGAYALHAIASDVFGIPMTQPTREFIGFAEPGFRPSKRRINGLKKHARLVAHEIDRDKNILWVSDADSTQDRIPLGYGDMGRSELYKENIEQAVETIGLPFSLSAIDVEIDSTGHYSPRMLIIEPDYLLDISMIAECYQDTGGDVRLYVMKKFQSQRLTPHLLIGKVVNFFLDELVHDPDRKFEELFPNAFFLNPIEFANLDDQTVWQMMDSCKVQFRNLREVVKSGFQKENLDRNKMYIEPAFFSPQFGIQGRLDLFQSDDTHKYIIELKSGQAFKANAYGLSSSHYAQTLLYDLMIKAVFDFKPLQSCYILYSKYSDRTLRYAPPVEAIQREVIRLRNDMLIAEIAIGKQSYDSEGWFERINPEAFPEVKGFLEKDIEAFHSAWHTLDALEKKYVRIFSAFVAREHYLAKVGEHGNDQVNGLASLWLDTDIEKEERFAIYRNLSVKDILIEQTEHMRDAFLVLRCDQPSGSLVNFRIGDIAVLYPMNDTGPGILKNQIYKCTVTSLGDSEITIRLRSGQVSYEDIRSHPRWSLEHDLYDRSFNTMHSSLFGFAAFAKDRRDLFLGRKAPSPVSSNADYSGENLGGHQKDILLKIIQSRDYFLLWGPPGTGKTSVILHHLVRYYLNHTAQRIILLAYTNRAVDEICEAIDAIGKNIRNQYVRIGSRVSTGPQYREQLLGNRIQDMQTRKEVVGFLHSQRIIVGTISSVAGRPDLFNLIKPDIAIIDEASQILEPMLSGILPGFKKWILIGDHRQLPAVVAQPSRDTALEDSGIPEIELDDTRYAYFERMFYLCRSKGWDWAYGSLTEQGRMHAEIMRFPGKIFYDDQLELLSTDARHGRDYTGSLKLRAESKDDLERMLCEKRLIWLPSEPERGFEFNKTHDDEARIVTEVVMKLRTLYDGIPEIGIITPFRAQIANIRSHLASEGIDPNALTIDTVERYQGSARDIIILSLSIHHPGQLQMVVSESREGVDRKLNVALTRAREQFILVASESAIRSNKTYSALARECTKLRYQAATGRTGRKLWKTET